MSDNSLRLAGVMMGDIQRDPAARIKYGLFFDALARHFPLVDVYDASLHGLARLWNAVQVFHPNLTKWKKRFWINVPSFHARSKLASNYLNRMKGKADVAFQIGAIFDSNSGVPSMPTVVYIDYNVQLAARRPEAGRAPLSPSQLKEWVSLETLTYQRAAHIFTRAAYVRDSIISDYGIPSDKVTAVGGGINFERIPEAVPHPKEETPVVLFIGRDFRRKGGDLMLDAFARTRQSHPSARLLFLTRNPIPDGFSLDGVEVISAGWDREKIIECFHRSNIFVLSSRLETWGDVLLEAMAYGLACVGMDVPPMTEILDDGRTGMLVLPENVNALSAGLMKLFDDGDMRCHLGEAARTRALDFYTWDHVIKRMIPAIYSVGTLLKGE